MEYIYGQKIKLNFPDGYVKMNPEEIKLYYGNQVNIADGFIEQETKSVIGIALSERSLTQEDVENQILQYHQIYSRMAPGFTMGEILKKSVGNHDIAMMTFKSNAVTRDLYNMIIITNLDGKEFMVSCSCDMRNAVEMMPKYTKIVDKIEFCD